MQSAYEATGVMYLRHLNKLLETLAAIAVDPRSTEDEHRIAAFT